ncbi:hypothetical protein K8I28_15930 [bacterium]|nr:hypothetical protein [bacterium]
MRNIVILLIPLMMIPLRAFASEYLVDPAIAHRLNFENLEQYEALTGRPAEKMIALWVARADSFQYMSRSGAEYSISFGGGSFTQAGGATGGDMFANSFDGITDVATVNISLEDSLDPRSGGMMIELLFKPEAGADFHILSKGGDTYEVFTTKNPTHHYLLLRWGSGEGYLSTAVVTDEWNLARIIITSDQAYGKLNNSTMQTRSIDWESSSNSLHLGRRVSTSGYYRGDIGYLAFYDGIPDAVERDTLWNLLSPHLYGDSSFASLQTALDFASHKSDTVTISLARGLYGQPLYFSPDSTLKHLILNGSGVEKSIINGQKIATGKSVLNLTGDFSFVFSGFSVQNSPQHGFELSEGVSGKVERVIFSEVDSAAIHLTENSTEDTLFVHQCTFDDGGYAVTMESDDSTTVYLENSILTNFSNIALLKSGSPGELVNRGNLFYANNTDYSGSSENSALLHAPPMFVQQPANNYSLNWFSPAINRGTILEIYDADGSLPDLGAMPYLINYEERWMRDSWSR